MLVVCHKSDFMNKVFIEELFKAHQECPNCSSPEEISNVFIELLGILFPDHSKVSFNSVKEFEHYLAEFKVKMVELLTRTADSYVRENAEPIVTSFFNELPSIRTKLNQDAEATYEGDPAAKNIREIIRTYPGFYAIAAYRIAHSLHQLKVTGVPRVITEYAHSRAGIDIHPAAKIGNHFCIDHGTGIVIGETCVIGNYVKMYQGVTLGALSVNKEDALKKRHPTIEDQVVLYAGATILGGETNIGHDSVIGGNVWITQSVPAYSKIYYQSRMIGEDGFENTDLLTFKNRQ